MESQKAGDKWWSPLGRLGLSSTVQSSPSKPTRGERERERGVRRNQIGHSSAAERWTYFGLEPWPNITERLRRDYGCRIRTTFGMWEK